MPPMVALSGPHPSAATINGSGASTEPGAVPTPGADISSATLQRVESAVQPELRKGKYPDRKVARRVSEVVRAVASELDA